MGENYKEYSVDELVDIAKSYGVNLVEITGGEPLEQEETPLLAKKLVKNGFTVLLETNGSRDISVMPKDTVKIVDVKLPWVGQKEYFYYKNLNFLKKNDELKFVIDCEKGYEWAKNFIKAHDVASKIIFSPCSPKFEPKVLAEMIISDKLDVRFGLQVHRVLWGNKSGV
jgi:7-carboxy-7-deazaguanine synthase